VGRGGVESNFSDLHTICYDPQDVFILHIKILQKHQHLFQAECLKPGLSCLLYYFQTDTVADIFTTNEVLFFEAVPFQPVAYCFGGHYALQYLIFFFLSYMEYILKSIRGKQFQIPYLPL
jgi:hypothetical protein